MTDPGADGVRPAECFVLYIGGEGRSGSTLLSSMLGRYQGYLPVGELRSIWAAAQANELCGCGLPFNECEFWIAVGREAFGGWERIDIGRMLKLDNDYVRHRFVGRLLVPVLGRRHTRRLQEFRSVLRSLYLAVREESGGSVIVDSSKDPTYALLLQGVPGLDLRVVHLVRDSRGVAYSWSKGDIPKPEYANHPELSQMRVPSRQAWRAALLWDVKNILCHRLGKLGVSRVRMRYESFVTDPDTSLQRILTFVQNRPPTAINPGEHSSTLHEFESLSHHTLGGNRIRFARGTVKVRPDDEWRRSMGARQRLIVSTLTVPLLLAYGYMSLPKPVSERRNAARRCSE